MDNKEFLVQQSHRGAVTKLQLKSDSSAMNWVIDPAYLAETGYHDEDKLFGEFTLRFNEKNYNSIDYLPEIKQGADACQVTFKIGDVRVSNTYKLHARDLQWNIALENMTNRPIKIENFGVWASFAYIMFRDLKVQRNANQSAAVFPSISPNYTKLAVVRRDNTFPNLGLYQTAGSMQSVGTYNEYCNRFFENVSPSLDGMLFHQLVLAGGYPNAKQAPTDDWIYSRKTLNLSGRQEKNWEFRLASFTNQDNFYEVAQRYEHPYIQFAPLVTNTTQKLVLDEDSTQHISKITDCYQTKKNLQYQDLTAKLEGRYLEYAVSGGGEHQIIIEFDNGKTDMIVFNKMNSIKQLLRQRADYIIEHAYLGPEGTPAYGFAPISNQGESIGKMNFVIQECLLDPTVKNRAQKIRLVEESAVKYVREKWFENGDFRRPRKLYGDFYRVMDLEYIAHLYFLLSQCDDQVLRLHTAKDYLKWAAEVLNVRVNPNLHEDPRGKAEAQMLGQYFLYVEDLLEALKAKGLDKEEREIETAWQNTTERIAKTSNQLSAAVTEHFYDNAGFGPAAGALALAGYSHASRIYGELLKANIGYSNDFRAQSPDRWWEALSYMIHSLWGGVTAASAVITGRELNDPALIKAGNRATAAVLYMYDANATTTKRKLKTGEAASTYSIAGPNLNRPDLSRDRFGQSVFYTNGGIFSKLFPNGYTGEDDWDMGEELVAYLNGLGQETYVFQNKNGEMEVINGQIIAKEGLKIVIRSHAPYPTRYIDLDSGNVLRKNVDEVIYDTQQHCFESEKE